MSALTKLLTQQLGGSDETFSKEAQAKAVQAQADLFLKMASTNNIDLSALPREKVMELWHRFYAGTEKQAGAVAPPAGVDPALAEAARAEVEGQQAKVARDQEAFEFGKEAGRVIFETFAGLAKEAGFFPFPPKKDEDDKGKDGPPPADKKDGDKGKDGKKDDDKEKKASHFDQYTHAVAIALVKQACESGQLRLTDAFLAELPERLWAANVVLPVTDPRSKVAATAGAGHSFEAQATLRAYELIECVGIPVSYEQ